MLSKVSHRNKPEEHRFPQIELRKSPPLHSFLRTANLLPSTFPDDPQSTLAVGSIYLYKVEGTNRGLLEVAVEQFCVRAGRTFVLARKEVHTIIFACNRAVALSVEEKLLAQGAGAAGLTVPMRCPFYVKATTFNWSKDRHNSGIIFQGGLAGSNLDDPRLWSGNVIAVRESVALHLCEQVDRQAPIRGSRQCASRGDSIVSSVASSVQAHGLGKASSLSLPVLQQIAGEKLHEPVNIHAVSHAKRKVETAMRGNNEEEMKLLPGLARALQDADDQNILDIRLEGSPSRFDQCVVVLGCGVRMVNSGHLRDIYVLDGAHCSVEGVGVILSFSTFGPDDEIILLAFSHAPVESRACWEYFLRIVTSAMPILQDSGRDTCHI